MRILNVIHSVDPRTGGPAEGLRQMCRATARMGHLQEVLTLDQPRDPWVLDFPGPVHAVGPRWLHYGFTPELVPWLQASARNFDGVIVHGLWQYQGLAVRRALRGRVPYFVYPHGMLDPWFRRRHPVKHLKKQLYWRAFESRVLHDAAGVLFTTLEEAELARDTFAPCGMRPLHVGYGIAPDAQAEAATPADFLALHPRLQGRRLLLFLSRLHPKKGLDLLLEAFVAQASARPDLDLVIAGPDQAGLRAPLQALARQAGCEARVHWVGMLQGAPKWGALKAADAFVLPSHQENFGIAVAESLAAGTPVLISDKVNIWREVVAEGAGFVDSDDPQGTTRLLARWLALSDGELAAMRRAARACFARHFHVDRAARTLLDTIRAQAGRVHAREI